MAFTKLVFTSNSFGDLFEPIWHVQCCFFICGWVPSPFLVLSSFVCRLFPSFRSDAPRGIYSDVTSSCKSYRPFRQRCHGLRCLTLTSPKIGVFPVFFMHASAIQQGEPRAVKIGHSLYSPYVRAHKCLTALKPLVKIGHSFYSPYVRAHTCLTAPEPLVTHAFAFLSIYPTKQSVTGIFRWMLCPIATTPTSAWKFFSRIVHFAFTATWTSSVQN